MPCFMDRSSWGGGGQKQNKTRPKQLTRCQFRFSEFLTEEQQDKATVLT